MYYICYVLIYQSSMDLLIRDLVIVINIKIKVWLEEGEDIGDEEKQKSVIIVLVICWIQWYKREVRIRWKFESYLIGDQLYRCVGSRILDENRKDQVEKKDWE